MKSDLLAKITGKVLVVFTIVSQLATIARIIPVLRKENTFMVGLSQIDNPIDLTFSFLWTFNFIGVILVIIGGIHAIRIREFHLNRYFYYPIYWFFYRELVHIIYKIVRKVNEESDAYLEKSAAIPWYDYLQIYGDYLLFAMIILYFAIRKQRGLKNPLNVHKLKRLFNWLVDSLHISVVVLIYVNPFTYSGYSGWGLRNWSFELNIALFCFIFLYYFTSELLFGQTIGKIPDNSFVYYKGNRLKAIFIRTLCRFIPFEPFSFLFSKKGWHDKLSNTSVVIEARSYSEESTEKMADENKTSQASSFSENPNGSSNF